MFDLPQPFGPTMAVTPASKRSEEHTSELQSQSNLVCRLLLEKKKQPLHSGPRPDTSKLGYNRATRRVGRPEPRAITSQWVLCAVRPGVSRHLLHWLVVPRSPR